MQLYKTSNTTPTHCLLLEYNVQAGVDGFWVAGGTGESVLLSEQENMRLAELSVKQNRGRVVNIHHVGAVTTRQ